MIRVQDLWESLEDLDAHAWVQDGDSLPRSATHRRVALGGHASLLLDLDPRAPKQPPTCRFLGAVCAPSGLQCILFTPAPLKGIPLCVALFLGLFISSRTDIRSETIVDESIFALA